MKKLLKITALLVGFVGLVVVLLSLMVVDVMRPEPTAPELRARTPTLVRASPILTASGEPGCGVSVHVVDTEGPVAAVEVVLEGTDSQYEDTLVTGENGWTERIEWPCESVRFQAQDGADRSRWSQLVLSPTRDEILLRLEATIRVHGRIFDTGGVVLTRAGLDHDGDPLLIDAGWFDVRVPADSPLLIATAPGYHSGVVVLDEALVGGRSSVAYDFTLEPDGRVAVYCAGRPGDSCTDILVQCTAPMLPVGDTCHEEGGVTMCICPDGDAAIRGGGRAVMIEDADVEAWLDFRDTGSITGRLVDAGVPVSACQAGAIRIPVGLEDVSRGFVVSQKARCDAEGRFTFTGLVGGDWEIAVKTGGDIQRVLLPHSLPSGVVVASRGC